MFRRRSIALAWLTLGLVAGCGPVIRSKWKIERGLAKVEMALMPNRRDFTVYQPSHRVALATNEALKAELAEVRIVKIELSRDKHFNSPDGKTPEPGSVVIPNDYPACWVEGLVDLQGPDPRQLPARRVRGQDQGRPKGRRPGQARDRRLRSANGGERPGRRAWRRQSIRAADRQDFRADPESFDTPRIARGARRPESRIRPRTEGRHRSLRGDGRNNDRDALNRIFARSLPRAEGRAPIQPTRPRSTPVPRAEGRAPKDGQARRLLLGRAREGAQGAAEIPTRLVGRPARSVNKPAGENPSITRRAPGRWADAPRVTSRWTGPDRCAGASAPAGARDGVVERVFPRPGRRVVAD